MVALRNNFHTGIADTFGGMVRSVKIKCQRFTGQKVNSEMNSMGAPMYVNSCKVNKLVITCNGEHIR